MKHVSAAQHRDLAASLNRELKDLGLISWDWSSGEAPLDIVLSLNIGDIVLMVKLNRLSWDLQSEICSWRLK